VFVLGAYTCSSEHLTSERVIIDLSFRHADNNGSWQMEYYTLALEKRFSVDVSKHFRSSWFVVLISEAEGKEKYRKKITERLLFLTYICFAEVRRCCSARFLWGIRKWKTERDNPATI
jgi:hypothetical protein